MVNDSDVAAIVFNQPGGLQRARGDRDTGASHAEHVRNELLRQREIVRLYSESAHQQPAGEPLFNRVQRVADGYLRNLRDEQARVAQQESLKLAVAFHL